LQPMGQIQRRLAPELYDEALDQPALRLPCEPILNITSDGGRIVIGCFQFNPGSRRSRPHANRPSTFPLEERDLIDAPINSHYPQVHIVLGISAIARSE